MLINVIRGLKYMKKIIKGCLLTLSLLSFSLALPSCSPTYIKGETGEMGETGPKGEDGKDGKDGSIFHHGEGKPGDSLGKNTDLYLDSTSGDLYTKENGCWSLIFNIKGENGKDGQDGSDGHDGLNGSDGKDALPAYSSTILPTDLGYIIPSVGSAKVGEEITFTFYPNEGVESTFYSFKLKDNKGNIICGSSADQNVITATMVEGGFIAYVEKVEATPISSAEEFDEAIANLKPGENVIELTGDLDLTNATIAQSPSISTFSSGRKTNDNKLNKKDIIITNENDEPIDLTIYSKNKEKLSVPILNIKGNNVRKFTLKNIMLECMFDPAARNFKNDINELQNTDFINCSGVDELIFQNVDFSLNKDEYCKYYDDLTGEKRSYESLNRISLNFIDFEGRKLVFNHFIQDKKDADFLKSFIDMFTRNDYGENVNENLEEIEINQSIIYCSNPFRIQYTRIDSKLRNVDIKNSKFYLYTHNSVYKSLNPFFEIYNRNAVSKIGNGETYIWPELNINIKNSSYEQYLFNLNENGSGGWWVDRDSLFPITTEIYMDRNGYTQEADGIVDLLKDPTDGSYLFDYNNININLDHFEVNGSELTSSNFTKLPYFERKIRPCIVCLQEVYQNEKDGKENLNEPCIVDSLDDVYLFNLWINEDNPLVSSRLLVKETACITTYNWFTSVSGETLPYDHNLINGFIYDDLNVYPSISIDNEEVHKQDYYETEPYKPTKEEMDYIFKEKILDNFYGLRDYSFLKQYYPKYFGDESSN